MKLVVVMMIACFMQVSASSFGQKISLSEKNTSLEEVLNKIKTQTGYDILYADYLLDKANKVNLKFNNLPLNYALEQVFEDQPLVYELKDKTIIIKAKTPSFLDKVVDGVKSYLANIDVTGKVVDENGAPLSGASIVLKSNGKGVSTAVDWRFRR